jgi:hypothetical protein
MSREKTKKSDYFLFAKNINMLAVDNGGKYAFANTLGVVYDSVRRWCIGETLPGGNQLLMIRDKFGVSIDWLLTGDDPAPVKVPTGIHETGASYGSSPHHCPYCGDMSEEVKDLCSRVKKIMESGHRTAVPALVSNITAFEDSVKQTEEIEKLKQTVRHHSKLLQAEHRTGSGKAAGAGAQKRKM